jgi:hopanoid biosynthesis associated protein HpnK
VSPPRRLIVSADDFGMSAGANAGIIRAHRNGILGDASLMVNGQAFADAVELARDHPRLSIGLHLMLVQGRAAAPAADIPLLAGPDGLFGNLPVVAGMRYFFTPGVRAQLRREIDAQLDNFRATRLPLSHVDGHLTIHMHRWCSISCSTRARYGIRAVRLPREPSRRRCATMAATCRASSSRPWRSNRCRAGRCRACGAPACIIPTACSGCTRRATSRTTICSPCSPISRPA